jgi:hypothetical protein
MISTTLFGFNSNMDNQLDVSMTSIKKIVEYAQTKHKNDSKFIDKETIRLKEQAYNKVFVCLDNLLNTFLTMSFSVSSIKNR